MELIEKLDKVIKPEQFEEYGNMSYEEQNDLFLKFKKPFDYLNTLNTEEGNYLFPKLLEHAVILSINGNPVAQDFLTYIYKKGKTGVMKPNLLRAYEWGIIASNSISMLAVDRLKFFYNPAYEKIASSDKLDEIIRKYDLTVDDIEYFFACNIADMIMSASDISLERLSKEELIPQDFSEVKIKELERVRDRVIENMLDLLLRD